MRIDHFGIIVENIKAHIQEHYAHWIDSSKIGELIFDPLQKVRICFVEFEGGRLEFIEPAGEDSPISRLLKQKSAWHHHVCFGVKSMDEIERCREKGMMVVSPPRPAVAFGGRRVAFLMGADLLLWELLED